MPLDRGAVEQQLEAIGESRWWDRRELRDLPAALHADERILALALGKLQRPRLLRRPWLIVVTSQRLVCLRAGRRLTREQVEVPANQIIRVSMRVGPFRARLLIAVSGDRYRLLVRRPDAYKLLAALSSVVQEREAAVHGAWPGLMFGRVIRHVLELPAVALKPDTPNAKPAPDTGNTDHEKRLQLLEEQVQQIQRKVYFLEDLLRQRQIAGTAASVR
jgi:hypothetical protein